MKQKINIPVVFSVKAENEEEAKEFVNRVLRYGFEAISEHERETWKAIKYWNWAEIRGAK